MTVFLGLLKEDNKAAALREAVDSFRADASDNRLFTIEPSEFRQVPGAPFAYWVTDAVRSLFRDNPQLEQDGREVQSGASTMNDFRFLRLWWEISDTKSIKSGSPSKNKWVTVSKGGSFARYYIDWELKLNWEDDGREIKEHVAAYRGSKGWGYHWAAALNGYTQYFRPGLTWPRRSQKGLSVRVLPGGSIFGDKGPTIFVPHNDKEQLLAILALTNSPAFFELVRLQMAFGSYEVGVLERTPIPQGVIAAPKRLAELAHSAWSKNRALDCINETSHSFCLPYMLQTRYSESDPSSIHAELAEIQSEIDEIAFDLYGFSETDRAAALESSGSTDSDAGEDADDNEHQDAADAVSQVDSLVCWTVGVGFGRFDWRLATSERDAPPEPDPFDPLPARSPGMLPDGAAPFHVNTGILVDDQGHPHDLPRLIEEVLSRVDAEIPGDVRRWLQRDFFKLHLKHYSKSRRKAPIYWPLSTASGDYTLWLYYPDLTDQTLFTAVNDFVEPKLQHLETELNALRRKGQERTSAEEREFEKLQTLQEELVDLRDTLLQLAPTYKPNHDDGVQITAAPLWRLFRHKPWQKVLKDTWEKLEAGDYDWAHLAMTYWPERVREKCKSDNSLAIAHDLEHLYEEPEEPAGGARKRRGGRSSA